MGTVDEKFEFVVSLLKDNTLNLNLKKCRFGIRKLDYLRYVIGDGAVQPGERKVKSIEEFPRPESKHDVR